ncbi:MAG TPA: cytochrome P450 [Streptomyces sp.]|uniref:cytochrome P450 n=1 Tax=Streptomyces sp. TaxID=1931 RepID=UPI002D2CD63F|nr:cytochrome P450 [Streptomyces sp.]HZG06286.1 cytochrome P450 [Streptomyces sp.]
MTTSRPVSDAVPPPGCPAHAAVAGGTDTPGRTGLRAAERMYGPEFAADPMATFTRLRAHGSVAPVEIAPGVDAWVVLGYETALEVLRSPERFSKDPRRWKALAEGRVPANSPVVPMMMYRPNALWTDGEEHSRLRRVITDSLGRVDPNALRSYVERSADTLIDRFGPRGEADLLGEYGAVLPLLVFEQLFGCPADIGDKMVRGMAGIFDANADSEKANALLTEAVAELVALKRRQPGPDVTSWMMAHPSGLTDEEMIHQLVLLLGAGTEPEQNLICNGLRLLLSDDRFAGDLAGGSMPVEDALDEVLWTDPPMANYAIHYPIHDVELDGTLLREGEPILISFTAVNNDPTLVSDRRVGNRAHITWGVGPHTCAAKGSARLIAAVAVEKLLDRIPDIELAVGVEELEWRQGPFNRGLVSLPVRFPPIAPAQRPSEDRGRDAEPVPSSPLPSAPAPVPGGTGSTDGADGADRSTGRWWSSLARWWRGR